MEAKLILSICFWLLLASTGTTSLAQSNRTKYEGSYRQKKPSNRVYFPGFKALENSVDNKSSKASGEKSKRIESPSSREELSLEPASWLEKEVIKGMLSKYVNDRAFKVHSAFRDLMPSERELEIIFNSDEVESRYKEYIEEYDENFQKGILRRVTDIDLNRTKVYRMTLRNLVRASSRWYVSNLDIPVLKADFYWPEDTFEVTGVHPIITLYFVEVEEKYKIFHIQAIANKNPKP